MPKVNNINWIEPIEAAQEQQFDDHSEQCDRQRRENQRGPVIHAEGLQPDVRGEGAEHVERAMREIHDAEQSEDHR